MNNPNWYNETQADLPTIPVTNTPYAPSGPIAPPPPPMWPEVPDAPQGAHSRPNMAGRFALGAVVALVLMAAIAGGVYVARHAKSAGNTTSGAVTAAQGYCSALQQGNATSMYSSFAPALQSAMPATTFAAIVPDVTQQEGAVTACQVGQSTPSADGKTASVAVTVTHQAGTSATSTPASPQALAWQFGLVGSAWQLTQMPDASFLPRATIFNYCGAVQQGNYAAAYALFAAPLQQLLLSAADYGAISSDIDAENGHATACATTGVDVAADGSAMAHLTLTRKQPESDTVALTAPGSGAAMISQAPDTSLLPRTTGYVFCQDMIAKNYIDAFAQFTPSSSTASSFAQQVNTYTLIFGPITACKAKSVTLSADQQSAQLSGTAPPSKAFSPRSNMLPC